MVAGGMVITVIWRNEKKSTKKEKRPMKELLDDTKATSKYIKDQGYNI